MERRLIFALLLALVGCATGAPNRSTATVMVNAITPVAASVVQQSSVVEATVAYTIDKFELRGDTYYLLVRFEDSGGGTVEDGYRLADRPILAAAKGSVLVTYPLSRVWNNPKLKKPIHVWFEVVERVGPNDSVVIGRTGSIEYAAK